MIVANKVGETGSLLQGGFSREDTCPGSWDRWELSAQRKKGETVQAQETAYSKYKERRQKFRVLPNVTIHHRI